MRGFLIMALSALMMACAPTATSAPADGPVTMTLTRSICFGFCPDYTVSIDQDGVVRYEGRRFVNVTGVQQSQVSAAEVQALLARFDAVDFMSLRDEYRSPVSDMPTYTLTLTRNGRTKTVIDYAGTGAGMPQAVRDLEAEIDRVANTAQWVLRNGEPVRGQR
ncbi:MAG: DUF6438 domain-containing protein [Hyphomonadaceae bacterium]|nr:DUF6438 domain-containing protein [Hyphomonadaceae bacterium]